MSHEVTIDQDSVRWAFEHAAEAREQLIDTMRVAAENLAFTKATDADRDATGYLDFFGLCGKGMHCLGVVVTLVDEAKTLMEQGAAESVVIVFEAISKNLMTWREVDRLIASAWPGSGRKNSAASEVGDERDTN